MAENRQGGDDLEILVRKDSGTQQLTDWQGRIQIPLLCGGRGLAKIVLIYSILKQFSVMWDIMKYCRYRITTGVVQHPGWNNNIDIIWVGAGRNKGLLRPGTLYSDTQTPQKSVS